MSLNKPFGVAIAVLSFVVAQTIVRRDSFAGKVVVITGGSRGDQPKYYDPSRQSEYYRMSGSTRRTSSDSLFEPGHITVTPDRVIEHKPPFQGPLVLPLQGN